MNLRSSYYNNVTLIRYSGGTGDKDERQPSVEIYNHLIKNSLLICQRKIEKRICFLTMKFLYTICMEVVQDGSILIFLFLAEKTPTEVFEHADEYINVPQETIDSLISLIFWFLIGV